MGGDIALYMLGLLVVFILIRRGVRNRRAQWAES